MFIFQGSIITNFLSQNGQQYKIPVYQRNYEWSRNSVKSCLRTLFRQQGEISSISVVLSCFSLLHLLKVSTTVLLLTDSRD